jgi:two-component system LytT family response regulator
MSELAVLIVDDETHARERLRRLLDSDPEIEIVGECASGNEAVAAVAKLKPDLMLLDIQMPELDGFGVIEAIPRDELPMVVFVTAHDEHALHAFDVHAVDYVLKPVEAPRLQEAIGRARQRRSPDVISRPQSPNGEGEPVSADEDVKYFGRILVRQDGQIYPIHAREIHYVESFGNYVKLHTSSKQFTVRETMLRMEQRLDPEQFARIHRSVIVNLDAVSEMQPWFAGDFVVILKSGVRLKVSRSFKARLEKWMLG